MRIITITLFCFFAFIISAQTDVNYKPTVIPVTDTEILNNGRGLFRWINREGLPYPSMDNYSRYSWSDLESSQGVYNFTALKTEAEYAKNDPDGRGTFVFGVGALSMNKEYCYPTYLALRMNTWYSDIKKCWVPDWNSPYFLERQDSLVANLGRTFNNDERISAVEIRSYGNWGEFHVSGFETPPSPVTGVTTATLQHMIDTYIKAFPNKQLIIMSDNAVALDYAMSKTGLKYPIGWRRDSWCNSVFDAVKSSSAWTKASNRWKTAPVLIESYGKPNVNYGLALNHVVDYHVSGIGNSDAIATWNSLAQTDKNILINCFKYSGYRFIIRSITYPATFVPGQTINLKSEWSNVGVAPIYRDWKVTYRITNQTTGAVVLEIPSVIDLKLLLPTYSYTTTIDTPIFYNDSFVLPANFTTGNYNLEVIVSDPTNYLAPLKLAIQGRKTTGTYGLGAITVDAQNAVTEQYMLNDFFITGISNSEIKLTIQTAGVYSYSVYNLEGKAVLAKCNLTLNSGDQYIDINAIPKGFYIFKMSKDNNFRSIRFVK